VTSRTVTESVANPDRPHFAPEYWDRIDGLCVPTPPRPPVADAPVPAEVAHRPAGLVDRLARRVFAGVWL
jgi:hypothetical protein